jgi:hypothetical protein
MHNTWPRSSRTGFAVSFFAGEVDVVVVTGAEESSLSIAEWLADVSDVRDAAGRISVCCQRAEPFGKREILRLAGVAGCYDRLAEVLAP